MKQKLYLYHYFESKIGAFISMSDLSLEEAMKIQTEIDIRNTTFHVGRKEEYYKRRKYLEQLVREMFVAKGGKPILTVPHYMVIGECPWLASWFEKSDYVKIPIDEFDLNTVSFTYGDTFPTFSPHVTDELEYRKQVYTYEEIINIIKKYGMPQDLWNEPIFAQPAYVEAQVWSDIPINRYRTK
ncbi:MAG TPA: hypothetical protein DEQ30_06535 [Porphyromonadaceae bacterium]|nr:hypothetical protein [Porphyromonadaceae bacterium]